MAGFPRYAKDVTNAVRELAALVTEYNYPIPDGTTKLKFQNRAGNIIRYAFVTGKVATPTDPYFTLKADGVWYENDLNFYGKTLYLAGTNAGDVVEIESFQKWLNGD